VAIGLAAFRFTIAVPMIAAASSIALGLRQAHHRRR